MLIASLILLEVLIFAVLIFFFRRIMTQNVVVATKHLEELNQDYLKKEIEINRQLKEAQEKSQEILNKAQEEVARLKEQIIKEAEGERDKIITQARSHSDEIMQQADKARKLLISEMEEKISKEAINKACELIQFTLPEQFKQDVHSHWVDDLIHNGFNQLKRLRIPQDIREVRIASAFSLTAAQHKNILEKLKDVMGRDNIILKEEVDSKIVAGIIITIGSLVLDGSLKFKIQEQAKYAQKRTVNE